MAGDEAIKPKFQTVDVATFHVGAGRVKFVAHLDHICDASETFKAAFTSKFKESKKKSMDLPEEDVTTFELFMQWLYTQHYQMPREDIPRDGSTLHWPYLIWPIRLLVFSEKYVIPKLKHDVFSSLIGYTVDDWSTAALTPAEDAIEYAYQNTCQGSGIRKFLAQWYAFGLGNKWYDGEGAQDWLQKVPEFAIDILLTMKSNAELPSLARFFLKCDSKQYVD